MKSSVKWNNHVPDPRQTIPPKRVTAGTGPNVQCGRQQVLQRLEERLRAAPAHRRQPLPGNHARNRVSHSVIEVAKHVTSPLQREPKKDHETRASANLPVAATSRIR